MAQTATNPVARPTINTFETSMVQISAGRFVATVRASCVPGNVEAGDFSVVIRNGTGDGIAYGGDGNIVSVSRTDAAITVAAALAAFSGANLAARRDGLDAWLKARGLLP